MSKKILIVLLTIAGAAIIAGVMPANVKATTVDELQALIAQLQAQIQALQAQLQQVQGQEPVKWCHTFNKNLKIGDNASEIEALQTVLAKEGAKSWEYKGYDGDFDETTASEVVAFQEKYASEILTPYGLKRGTGYVGKSTRAKLNKLYGCNNGNGGGGGTNACTTDVKQCPDGSYVSRKGPNCEFAKCPEGPKACAPIVKQCPDGSFISGCAGEQLAECSSSATTTPVTPPIACTDSDGGKEYYTKGKVSDGTITSEDVCHLSVLDERYCINQTQFATESYVCPNGCSNGACIALPMQNTISVVSPNGGEQWYIGKSYDIKWKTSGATATDSKVNIDLVDYSLSDQTKTTAIAHGISIGNNSYTWSIAASFFPTNFESAGVYKAKITEVKSNGVYGLKDESDSYFSIVNSSACIGEGQTGIGLGGIHVACCPGLTEISNSFGSGNTCAAPTNGSFKCSYCGNGVCGIGENACNCPSDCKKTENLPPVVDGITAPTQLKVNEQGTWQVKAHDPENGSLTYSVDWGDSLYFALGDSAPTMLKEGVQTSTFIHSYSKAGTYTVTFTVTDNSYKSVKTSATVKVLDSLSTCADSDGGKSYYTKGTTKDGITSGDDVCDFTILKERYCDTQSKFATESYVCPNGCSNGTCIALPVQNSIDLEAKGTQKSNFDTYGFTTNFCVYGNKSINDLKKEVSSLVDFPFAYNVFDASGNKYYRYVGAGGGIEQIKNGTCNSLGWTIQPADQQYWNATGRVEIVVDPQNLIKETNENNNADQLATTSSLPARSITVLSPNGGEQVILGQTYTIKWNSTGVDKVGVLLIDYLPWGTRSSDITKSLSNQGVLYWGVNQSTIDAIGGKVGDNYKIRVYEIKSDGTIDAQDDSDNYFNIANTTLPVTCTDSDGGKDYFTKGITTWGPISGVTYNAADACDVSGTTLSEMYCSGGYSTVAYYKCPNGCSNGACNTASVPIAVSGRFIDRNTSLPVSNVAVYTDNSATGQALNPVYTNTNGEFSFSTSQDLGANGAKGFAFWPSCYIQGSVLLQKMTAGNLIAKADLFGTYSDISKDVINNQANLGDISLWPAVSVNISSDIPVRFSIDYNTGAGEIGGTGNSNYKTSHYLSNVVPLNYDVRVILTDANGVNYYSPYTKLPIANGCKELKVFFSNKQFSFSDSQPLPAISSVGQTLPNLTNGVVDLYRFKVTNSALTPISIFSFNFAGHLADYNSTSSNLKMNQTALYRADAQGSPISDTIAELGTSTSATEEINIFTYKGNPLPIDTIKSGETVEYILKTTVSGATPYDAISTRMSESLSGKKDEIIWAADITNSAVVQGSNGIAIPSLTWSLIY